MNASSPELTSAYSPSSTQQLSPFGSSTRRSKRGKAFDESFNEVAASAIPASSLAAIMTGLKGREGDSPGFSSTTGSPVTGGNAKRSGLRGKVKGALRRMVSQDEKAFSKSTSNLVYKADNDSHSTNIQSVHSGSTTGMSAMQKQQLNLPNLGGSNSHLQIMSTGRITAKPKITAKFNTSMRSFLANMAPNNSKISPKPPHSANRRAQRLVASMTDFSLPFESDDDDNDESRVHSDSDTASFNSSEALSGSLNRRPSRSKSPAIHRLDRRERRRRSKGMSPSTNEHSPNPRLRLRRYRRISNSKDSKDEEKKKMAASAPRPSQKLIRVEREEEGALPVPGEAFLLSVVDNVHNRMQASGALLPVMASESEDDNETDQGNRKKKRGRKRLLSRKRLLKKDKGKAKPSSDTDALSPDDDDEVAFCSPETASSFLGSNYNFVTARGEDPEGSSSTALAGFDINTESSDSKVDEDFDLEERSDIPPALEAMLEPEDQMLEAIGNQDVCEPVGSAPVMKPRLTRDDNSAATGHEESQVPLTRKSSAELKREAEELFRNFRILEPRVESYLEKAKKQSKREKVGRTSPKGALDAKLNLAKDATKKQEGSPKSYDDSVVLDVKALEKKQERSRKARRRSVGHERLTSSCPDLNEDNMSLPEVSRHGLGDIFQDGDFWENLLDELIPPKKQQQVPRSPVRSPVPRSPVRKPLEGDSSQSHLPQLLNHLNDMDPTSHVDESEKSVGSESPRGRSRSRRKGSAPTNGGTSRRNKAARPKEKRRSAGGERRKMNRKDSMQDRSGRDLELSENHHIRADTQVEAFGKRSRSHSKREQKIGGEKTRGGSKSMRRKRTVRERHQDERDRSTSKESRQGQPKGRDRSSSNSKRQNSRPSRGLGEKAKSISDSKITVDHNRSKSKSRRGVRHSDSKIDVRDRSSRSKSKSKRELRQSAQHGDSKTNIRDRSRSKSNSKSDRDLRPSAQHREHRKHRMHESEGVVDFRGSERNRSLSKSKSKRSGNYGGSPNQSKQISRSDPGRSFRRSKTAEGQLDQVEQDTQDDETAERIEGFYHSEGNLDYRHGQRYPGQSRSRSGRFNDVPNDRREKSRRRTVAGKGEIAKGNRNSVRRSHSESTEPVQEYWQPTASHDFKLKELTEKAELFKRAVDIQDRRYGLRTYKHCFVGSEAVDRIMDAGWAETREEAVELGNCWMKFLNLFQHVCDNHEFKDKHLFYKFGATAANSSKTLMEESDKPTAAVKEDKRHSRRERSSFKTPKRERSRSLDRARLTRDVVHNANEEVQNIRRMSISNDFGSSKSRDLRAHNGRKSGQDGRPRSSSRDHSRRTRKNSAGPTSKAIAEGFAENLVQKARLDDQDDPQRNHQPSTRPPKRRSSGDRRLKEKRGSSSDAKKRDPSRRTLGVSQSERQARTADETMIISPASSSSSERNERRVNLIEAASHLEHRAASNAILHHSARL